MNTSLPILDIIPKRRQCSRVASLAVVASGVLLFPEVASAQPFVDLRSAAGFGILAGSAITDAGGASSIFGNVGLFPTTGAAIGLTPSQVHNGLIYKS